MERTPVELQPNESYRRIGIYSWGKGFLHRPAVPASEMGSLRYFTFPIPSLVMSNIQAWEAAVALAGPDEQGMVASNRFLPYVENEPNTVDLNFLKHYFLSDVGLAALRSASPGTQVRNRTLGRKLFEELMVPLPELSEQRRIAAHLDAVAEKVNALTKTFEEADGLLVLSNALPASLTALISSAGLGETTVGDLIDVINDTIHPGDDPQGAEEFIGLEHIAGHFGFRVGSRPLGDERGRKFRFQPGDVTYGYLRPYQNKVWCADRVGLCSVKQFVLRPKPGVDAQGLAFALRSSRILDPVIKSTNSLQLPRLSQKKLVSLPIWDVRSASSDVWYKAAQLTQKFSDIEQLRAKRNQALGALLPAARNEVFNSLR